MRPLDPLQQLAKACKPTHRKFVEARVADPNHEMTAAARKAGSKRPADQGSRWMKRPEVDAYYNALIVRASEAVDAANALPAALPARYAPSVSLAGAQRAIATLEDGLRRLSEIMDARVGDFIREDGTVNIEAIRAAGPGVLKSYSYETERRKVDKDEWREIEKVKFTVADAKSAADSIVRHYDTIDAPPPAPPQAPFNLNVFLQGLPDDVVDKLADAMERMKRVQAIEVEAITR